MVVERFSSPALAAALPAESFTARHGQPGDLLVVYARRPDGRIAYIAVGIGDDAESLMSRLSDVRANSTLIRGARRLTPDPGQSVVYRMIRPSMQPLSPVAPQCERQRRPVDQLEPGVARAQRIVPPIQ